MSIGRDFLVSMLTYILGLCLEKLRESNSKFGFTNLIETVKYKTSDYKKHVNHSRFFENARPDEVFKYRSKSNALFFSVNAIAVFIRQGLYFEVCGHLP